MGLHQVHRAVGSASGHKPVIRFFELISIVQRKLTLAVGLYSNMFAGHMVLDIFAQDTGIFITVGIQSIDIATGIISLPWFVMLVVMYALETLVAFQQAYVFTVLSSVYIQKATSAH